MRPALVLIAGITFTENRFPLRRTCGSRAGAITSGGTVSPPACAGSLVPGIPCIAGVSKIAYATATPLRLQ